jgi:uncharacterized alkaline shock family protein YloU
LKVYALVGLSGTGKSYHSLELANEKGIEYIIDDGLLISQNRIICGKSAKKEKTKLASIRRALFTENVHAKSVASAIKLRNPRSILILGTSDGMVRKIAERLELPKEITIIKVEDYLPKNTIETARSIRETEGKHIIPVPTFEVKRHFSGYFVHPIKNVFRKKDKVFFEERTVVRPTYSFLGDFVISEKAIFEICEYKLSESKDVRKVLAININSVKGEGMTLEIDVILNYPAILQKVCSRIIPQLKSVIERMTAVNVNGIQINVKSIYLENNGRKN